jgi:hypothetical protein
MCRNHNASGPWSQNLQFEIFEKFKELIILLYERIGKNQ